MKCERCKYYALQKQLLAEYPDGDFPQSRARPLYMACFTCSHGCVDSEGASRCQTYTDKSKLEKKIASLEKTVGQLTLKAADKPDLYSYNLSKKRAELADAKSELEKCYTRCRTCNRTSDDNPSHYGVSFVSIDSRGRTCDTMPSCRRSSVSGETHSDDSATDATVGEWMLSKRLDINRPSKGGVTKLPYDIEDRMRVELANYSGNTSLVDKMLLAVLMTQKPYGRTNECFNPVDFAKLRWMFYFDAAGRRHNTDFSRFLISCGWRPPESGKCGISKQAVHYRFKTIVRKMPVLAAIAHGQMGKGKGGGATHGQASGASKKGARQIQADLFDASFDEPVE